MILSKNKLLNLGLVIDNEYLDKYISLINNNFELPYIKFKTQSHHIVPKYYFKLNNLKLDDSNNNKVNLLYKDHVLAHIYLGLCSSTNEYRRKNYFAVEHVIGNKNYSKDLFYNIEKDFLIKCDDYQKLYELSKEWWSNNCNLKNHGAISEEQKIKESEKNSNLLYINKNGKVIKIKPCDLNLYLNRGWKRGNVFISKNFKSTNVKKANNKRVGKLYINNNYVNLEINVDKLESYISCGWKRGMLKIDDIIKNISDSEWSIINNKIKLYYGIVLDYSSLPTKINVNNGFETLKIKKSKLYWYLLNEWNIGKLTKNEINNCRKSQ